MLPVTYMTLTIYFVTDTCSPALDTDIRMCVFVAIAEKDTYMNCGKA